MHVCTEEVILKTSKNQMTSEYKSIHEEPPNS